MSRFFALATARVLQTNRSVDVMSVRDFIGGNAKCNHKLAGRFKKLSEGGAVVGSDSGHKDESGYPYKRWSLSSAERAKDVLKEWHVKPMKADVIEWWQQVQA